jgi:hypothetical protein
VAATWEDNRSGAPQVYVALKANDRNRFATAMQVSGGGEAYEPAIASLPQNRFALAWEQDGSIHARVLTDDGLGMPVALGSAGASHVSLASFGSRVFASWREQRDRLWFVKVAALSVTAAGKLGVESITSVEAAGLETQVLFPSIAVNDAGLSVAWEDRRAGHTRLLVSHSPDQAQSFGEPQHLNEFLSNRNQYDQGNGVTRVSLASFAQDEILAAWMDKRRGGLGYGIFAALGSDGGAIFGPNEKVHGEAGDKQPHYNPAVAGNPDGDFVVAWDDFRRGDSDIWLSAYNEDDEWSQDFSGNRERRRRAVTPLDRARRPGPITPAVDRARRHGCSGPTLVQPRYTALKPVAIVSGGARLTNNMDGGDDARGEDTRDRNTTGRNTTAADKGKQARLPASATRKNPRPQQSETGSRIRRSAG